MQKKTKKIMLAIAGTALSIILILGFIFAGPFLFMKPARTGNIEGTRIYAVKNIMNSLYFIRSADGYILIDAGVNARAAGKVLGKIKLNPDEVKYIFLTHSDYDHVASLPLFRNAKIYMSEDELQMINGTTARNGKSYNSLPAGIKQDSLVLLKDGEMLNLGGHQILCMKAPGHTKGSMVYLLDGDYLFSGDAFRVSRGKVGVHPFSMDEDTSRKSIHILGGITGSSKLVLTAHYGYYQGDSLTIE